MTTITDKNLLEQAAKAAGYKVEMFEGRLCIKYGDSSCTPKWGPWNPLTNDGDALRLAVKLGLVIHPSCTDEYSRRHVECFKFDEFSTEVCSARQEHDDDVYRATRRAIVRAAAEIGKATT